MPPFLVKVQSSPSGVVKSSWGLGTRSAPPNLSVGLNFKEEPAAVDRECQKWWDENDMFIGDTFVKPGYGGLGNKPCMSSGTATNGRERMVAMEVEFGRDNCLFGTATLPSVSPRAFEGLARFSSYAVNRMSVWLKDRFKDELVARVGVWEYQKRGALHYHFALGGECIHAVDLKELRREMAVNWMSILESIESAFECQCFLDSNNRARDKQRLLDYDDLGQRFVNLQRVEKSIAGYLSSYLGESNHDDENGEISSKNLLRKGFYPIATWMQWNRFSTELFRKHSVECTLIIESGHFEDFKAIEDIVFGGFQKAEGTEELTPENEFWHSRVAIVSPEHPPEVNPAKELISMLQESGITRVSMQLVRPVMKRHASRLGELEILLHDEEVAGFKGAVSAGSLIGQRIANDMEHLLITMLECEVQVEAHSAFNKDMLEHNQLKLV